MKKWIKAGFLAGILAAAAIGGTKVYNIMIEDTSGESWADFVFIAPVKWNRIARGAMAAEEDFNVSVKYIMFSQDEERQIESMRYAMLSGADGIITAGMQDSDRLEETVDQIQEEGIPVLIIYLRRSRSTAGRKNDSDAAGSKKKNII